MTEQNKQVEGSGDNYFLKYYYDNVFVVGDNELKQNIEILIGKQALYCTYHDTRDAKQECAHTKFVRVLDESTKLEKQIGSKELEEK